VKDPERYLKAQKTDLRCVVNPGGHAVLEPSRRLFVNYEIFFFSTKGAMDLFRRKTLAYCGWLTDPVSGERFKPTVSSPKLVYKGRPYYFSTISTRMKFEAMPDSFAVRRGM
jgi:YHS domain-containing protein